MQFDFGANWDAFSKRALTSARVQEARRAFGELLHPIDLQGRSFLDIGFGQGLGLLTATAMGARAVGCDINPLCAQVLAANQHLFEDASQVPPVVIGSILDDEVLHRIGDAGESACGSRVFDVVHSWGVLHHTGDMARALVNASRFVAPDGYFVLAIYNRHWTSPIWRHIKRSYVGSPPWLQRAMVATFQPVIACAKWAVTRRNPFRQERGMDFHYDVIDWVGGYPYEYATCVELETAVGALGFSIVKRIPSRVPTGCNEFVFRRIGRAAVHAE